MTTQLPPDYEARHTLALALCEHLGLDPEQIETGSLRIELDTDNRHIVRWTGRAYFNLNDLTRLLLTARLGDPTPPHHPDDYPTQCRAQLPADHNHPHPGVAHYCHLANGHTDNHQCGICATTWEPNQIP